MTDDTPSDAALILRAVLHRLSEIEVRQYGTGEYTLSECEAHEFARELKLALPEHLHAEIDRALDDEFAAWDRRSSSESPDWVSTRRYRASLNQPAPSL